MTFKEYRWRIRRGRPIYFYDFGFIKCDICNHEWFGVYPEDSNKIKCENCLEIRHFSIIKEEEEYDIDE